MASESRGTIVTLYSYKGGTGRTMALANIAWILAANGKRVLVIDWDLESPGLHKFFAPFIDVNVQDMQGVIDLIRDYRKDHDRLMEKVGDSNNPDELIVKSALVQKHAFSLDWKFPGSGTLDFLPAGRQNTDFYAAALGSVDWDAFFEKQQGQDFLTALRADMKCRYDYVLIDSRTGLGDVADICTKELPDVLVDCFTLSNQGIEGAARVASVIRQRYARRHGVRILPVPMRVDMGERDRADRGHQFAVRKFAGLPEAMSVTERRRYWTEVEVPYQPYYSYEEILAAFVDSPDSPSGLLASYQRLTGYITNGEVDKLPTMDEETRENTKNLFTRRSPNDTPTIVLDHAPEDGAWADWLHEVLISAGAKIVNADALHHSGAEEEAVPRVLRLVASFADNAPGTWPPSYVVYVNGVRPVNEYAGAQRVDLSDDSETQAIDRLIQALGLVSRRQIAVTVRYPAIQPQIIRTPVRNTLFTGREEDLHRLRTQLRERGRAVVLPVTLQGLGGVGKTQVALEYVHRFKTDYDIVWWIDCGQPQFIDAALADLGHEIEKKFEPIAPVGATPREMAGLVLEALRREHPAGRWLLVYDNAEDVEQIQKFMPSGEGHLLVTSRSRAWMDQGDMLAVDVFTRAESISHLTVRVKRITVAEANEVAETLGDLPLAVAAAGALLAETGRPIPDYLEELRSQGPESLSPDESENPLRDYPAPVARAWDLSLEQLQQRSPAAVRLFELCALLAPDISMKIFNDHTMMELLSDLDRALQPPMVIDRLVRELNRLALVKHDSSADRIQVHRFVQAVVRKRMSPEELEEARRDVHHVLAAAKPKEHVDDPASWDGYRRLWPHLDSSEAECSTDDAVCELLLDRLRYLFLGADSERGLELAERVQSRWQEMLRDDPRLQRTALPRHLLHLRFNLANILRQLDSYAEAMELDREVYDAQLDLLGERHPHTLMTASSLAASMRALGNFRAALEMDKNTYATWRDLYGDDNVRTLSAANNLATSYRIVGEHRHALEIDESTLARRRTVLGDAHPRSLDSASGVARDLLEAGRYEDAVSRMMSVLDTSVRTEGPDSRRTLNSRVLLGIALRSAGRSQQAEQNFRAGLEGLTRRFGVDHSDTLACRLSNASNLLVLARFEEGEREIRAVMKVLRQRLGDRHAHYLVAEVNLASALRLQAKHTEALPFTEEALAGLRDTLGVDHPYTLAAAMVYATVKADQGDLDEAEALDADTARRMAATLGSRHPDTLRCQANHMLTEMMRGASWAAKARTQLIDELEKVVGHDHPNLATLRAERKVVRAVDPQPY